MASFKGRGVCSGDYKMYTGGKGGKPTLPDSRGEKHGPKLGGETSSQNWGERIREKKGSRVKTKRKKKYLKAPSKSDRVRLTTDVGKC